MGRVSSSGGSSQSYPTRSTTSEQIKPNAKQQRLYNAWQNEKEADRLARITDQSRLLNPPPATVGSTPMSRTRRSKRGPLSALERARRHFMRNMGKCTNHNERHGRCDCMDNRLGLFEAAYLEHRMQRTGTIINHMPARSTPRILFDTAAGRSSEALQARGPSAQRPHIQESIRGMHPGASLPDPNHVDYTAGSPGELDPSQYDSRTVLSYLGRVELPARPLAPPQRQYFLVGTQANFWDPWCCAFNMCKFADDALDALAVHFALEHKAFRPAVPSTQYRCLDCRFLNSPDNSGMPPFQCELDGSQVGFITEYYGEDLGITPGSSSGTQVPIGGSSDFSATSYEIGPQTSMTSAYTGQASDLSSALLNGNVNRGYWAKLRASAQWLDLHHIPAPAVKTRNRLVWKCNNHEQSVLRRAMARLSRSDLSWTQFLKFTLAFLTLTLLMITLSSSMLAVNCANFMCAPAWVSQVAASHYGCIASSTGIKYLSLSLLAVAAILQMLPSSTATMPTCTYQALTVQLDTEGTDSCLSLNRIIMLSPQYAGD